MEKIKTFRGVLRAILVQIKEKPDVDFEFGICHELHSLLKQDRIGFNQWIQWKK